MDDPRGQLTGAAAGWVVEQVPAGQDASDPQPGDFILCHRRGVVSGLIRAGELARLMLLALFARQSYRRRKRFAWASHAAHVHYSQTLIEALARGVTQTPLAAYRDVPYMIVRTQMQSRDRAQACAFAASCLGESYGFLTILGVALRFLTPGRGLWLGMDGTEICSGLVAQTQVRGWANFRSDPSSIAPSELAAYAGAPNPKPAKETMPTAAQLKQYLTLTVLPVAAGAAANWLLTHVHLLASFHVSKASVAYELTQLGVFGISAGLAFLASHHILKGSYQPTVLLGEPIKAELGTVTVPAPPVVVNVHPAEPAVPPTVTGPGAAAA